MHRCFLLSKGDASEVAVSRVRASSGIVHGIWVWWNRGRAAALASWDDPNDSNDSCSMTDYIPRSVCSMCLSHCTMVGEGMPLGVRVGPPSEAPSRS